MSPTEGYVKFTQEFREGSPPEEDRIRGLNEMRTRLYDLDLIGMYDNGIGFGNVSVRTPCSAGSASAHCFIVSGTATGGRRVLGPEDYTLVTDFNIDGNSVVSVGKTRASSESLSHGAVYAARPDVGCVVHVHSRVIFEAMLAGSYARTSPEAEYGTPEIAREIRRVTRGFPESRGALVMEGHSEGVIAFGSSVDETERVVMELHRRCNGVE